VNKCCSASISILGGTNLCSRW